MTPKEKAEELYYKYYQIVADCGYPEEKAKQCALIAVDEIINHIGKKLNKK
jgi:signal recognition particle subunit SEC65